MQKHGRILRPFMQACLYSPRVGFFSPGTRISTHFGTSPRVTRFRALIAPIGQMGTSSRSSLSMD